jgi:hypothetical protein
LFLPPPFTSSSSSLLDPFIRPSFPVPTSFNNLIATCTRSTQSFVVSCLALPYLSSCFIDLPIFALNLLPPPFAHTLPLRVDSTRQLSFHDHVSLYYAKIAPPVDCLCLVFLVCCLLSLLLLIWLTLYVGTGPRILFRFYDKSFTPPSNLPSPPLQAPVLRCASRADGTRAA